MNEHEVLKRLKDSDNEYRVSMYALTNSNRGIHNLAKIFVDVANIADRADIEQIKLVFCDLGEWSKGDLDTVFNAARNMIEGSNDFKVPKRARKLGYWYQDTNSYAFRVFDTKPR